MKHIHTLIIGAGPAGLSLAYHLQGDTLILEKENQVGGLCRSIMHQHGVFDIGGHSFHTPHPTVFELVQRLTPGGLFLQKREAFVYTQGTLIPYPFQKFYNLIPNPEVVKECEAGLLSTSGKADDAQDFEEYILLKFGQGIAEHFMLPYNRKLWARDIKEISCEWVSERVAAPKMKSETFDSSGGKRKPLQSDTRVGYPVRGGYEEIFKGLAAHVPEFKTCSQVIFIDPDKKYARTQDGCEYSWEFLVSTMPLPLLVRVVKDTPDEIVCLADQLEFMSLRVELLLIGRQLETPIQRIYISDSEIPPHKIALNHNSSAYLRSQKQHVIMAEVSLSPHKSVEFTAITSKTIDFLCENGILRSPNDVVWHGHVDVKYAYPVYTHCRPDVVKKIKAWLEQYNIFTLGRFGDWEYINSDHCIWKGIELAHYLETKWSDRT